MISLRRILQEVQTPGTWRDEDLRILNEFSSQIANQFGETVTGYLDSGAFGLTYRLASGKIMKITQDSMEIAMASKLRSKPKTRHIVSYYDVKQIVGLDRIASPNTYGEAGGGVIAAIIMDAVTTLNPAEKYAYREMRQHLLFDSYTTAKYLEDRLESLRVKTGAITPDAFNTMQRIIAQRDEIIADFKRHNIEVGEAHANNVGFDQFGQFVVFDVRFRDRWKIQSYATATMRGGIKNATNPIFLWDLQDAKPDASGIDTPGDPDM